MRETSTVNVCNLRLWTVFWVFMRYSASYGSKSDGADTMRPFIDKEILQAARRSMKCNRCTMTKIHFADSGDKLHQKDQHFFFTKTTFFTLYPKLSSHNPEAATLPVVYPSYPKDNGGKKWKAVSIHLSGNLRLCQDKNNNNLVLSLLASRQHGGAACPCARCALPSVREVVQFRPPPPPPNRLLR